MPHHTRANNEILSLPSRKDIIAVAESLVGYPSKHYESGRPEKGQSRDGFDCSGFVRYVLKEVGFHIPSFIGMDGAVRAIRHTNEFWDHYGVLTHEPVPGDLIFFSRLGTFPSHIGFYANPEQYIHAPGITDSVVALSSIRRTLIRRRNNSGRQLYRTNPIGFKTPTLPAGQPTLRYHQEIAE